MRLVRIADRHDPRLRDFLDLRDTQMRAAREPAEGFFLAEGEVTIRRALAAGYEPRAVLTTDRWIEALDDLASPPTWCPTMCSRRPPDSRCTAGRSPASTRRPLPETADLLADAHRVVVLEDLVDHTNVGAIFRSAAAFGWDAVLLTTRCADPLYRRAVRTSMGAVFSVPWTRIDHRGGIDDAARCRVHGRRPDPGRRRRGAR